MGAMLRFRQETGKDATEIDGSLTDLCTYLYCCVASACKHDGVEFGFSLMAFADGLTPEDLTAWSEAVALDQPEGSDGDAEKKS